MYYYHAWSGKEPTCILREFDDFRLEKYPFDHDTYRQFNGDVWRYWGYVNVSTNELGFVACRIFGICVNAASVERLWSCMGFLQNNRCNRLMVCYFQIRLCLGVLSYFLNTVLHITQSSKALEMSRLRVDITYSRRLYSNSSTITITSDELSSITMPNENTRSSNTESQNNDFDNSMIVETLEVNLNTQQAGVTDASRLWEAC